MSDDRSRVGTTTYYRCECGEKWNDNYSGRTAGPNCPECGSRGEEYIPFNGGSE